jgi:taurine transport system permease protein
MKIDTTAKSLSISIVSLLIFITAWELVCRLGFIEPLFMPAPSKILTRAMKMIDNGQLILHTLASTRRVMVGFLASSMVAIPVGIFLGSSRFFMAVFDPIISLLRPLPSMSWIPLSLLWLGISETQKYSIVFMGSFAPSLLYIIEATKSIDPLLIRAASRGIQAGCHAGGDPARFAPANHRRPEGHARHCLDLYHLC